MGSSLKFFRLILKDCYDYPVVESNLNLSNDDGIAPHHELFLS